MTTRGMGIFEGLGQKKTSPPETERILDWNEKTEWREVAP